MTEPQTAILLVDDWFTTCSHCGLQVLPEEKRHTNVSGYYAIPEGGGGCGALFVGVLSVCGDQAGAQAVRPDLPYGYKGPFVPIHLTTEE